MSKKTYITSDKRSQQKDNSKAVERLIANSHSETWQAAIDFASQKIDQLKTLIKIFGEYRDTGHPFPGEARHTPALPPEGSLSHREGSGPT